MEKSVLVAANKCSIDEKSFFMDNGLSITDGPFYLDRDCEKILNSISGAGAGQNIVSFAIGME